MKLSHPITPCLWFDKQAEEAAKFYVSIFPNSHIGNDARYGKEGFEIHGGKEGSVLTVSFTLNGQPFTALNGGPLFKFNEAISLQVMCDSQEEIDYYWDKLSAGGDPKAQQCGWLKDKFGVSWQVAPTIIQKMMAENNSANDRVMKTLLQMKKLDIAELEKAYKS